MDCPASKQSQRGRFEISVQNIFYLSLSTLLHGGRWAELQRRAYRVFERSELIRRKISRP